MKSDAIISPCGLYRYSLRRCWDETRTGVAFCMLNPSTADALKDDPTIRRCIGFAKRWGFGSLEVVNLFAYRATSPADLWPLADPIGPENDAHIKNAVGRASLIVAAWGIHGTHRRRGEDVAARWQEAKCLGVTKDGHPRHPLYIPSVTPLMDYRPGPTR
jgi:hypothetical protein